MKMVLLFLNIALCMTGISTAQPLKQYRVNVTIKDGIKNGKAWLRYFTDKGPHMDSASFSKGSFILSGIVPGKQTIAKLYLLEGAETSPKNENSCEVWLESGEIKITGKTGLINAEYSGSVMQEQFSELQNSLLPVKKKNFVLDDAYEKAEAEKDVAGKDKLLNEEYPALFNEKQKILGAFIRKYPSSPISAYKFEEFAGDGEMDLDIVVPVYDLLDSVIKTQSRILDVAKRIAINKRTAPGMEAIEFTQTDTSGKPVSLYTFRGKYLLIDFWAGWCVPCRAENPRLIKMYNQYSTKGFVILGVSLDGERKRWTNAIVTDKLAWPQVSDLRIFDNAIAKQYGITSIPQNILINPEGIIIAKNLRGNLLENKLAEIFK